MGREMPRATAQVVAARIWVSRLPSMAVVMKPCPLLGIQTERGHLCSSYVIKGHRDTLS